MAVFENIFLSESYTLFDFACCSKNRFRIQPASVFCVCIKLPADQADAWFVNWILLVYSKQFRYYSIKMAYVNGDSHSNRKVSVIIGAQWGDEGKGKIVDMLAKNVDILCRCQVGLSIEKSVII